MKSIEIYNIKNNNREKGMDSVDNQSDRVEAIETRIFTARCYILWGVFHRDKWKSASDRRVYCNGKPQTICIELKGKDRADALNNLDKQSDEFIEWWV